jgi:hypothetical protein
LAARGLPADKIPDPTMAQVAQIAGFPDDDGMGSYAKIRLILDWH